MKHALRQQKLLERLNHHPEERKRKESAILNRLFRLTEFNDAEKILFYLPVHGEVDLTPLFKRCKSKRMNKKFILPRVKDEKTLHLYFIDDITQVESGRYDIPEPKTHLPRANPRDIDLVLVPGVAFSADGHRIGYGKGFYDRLLKKPSCPKIGIAYDFQMVENIPAEAHDARMDKIVTEKKVIRIKTT